MMQVAVTNNETSEKMCQTLIRTSGATTPTQERTDMVPQDVLFPAYTCDYRIVNGACGGLGMIANRDMKKGEIVLTESLEFLFADVQEGDHIILVGHELASRESDKPVPERVPITRDMLVRTHGVPLLNESPDKNWAGVESYRLEVPWMLVNHSCEPNLVDSSHKEPEGEAVAARDIRKGEELTYDYTHQYYDRNLHSFKCLCGKPSCRKFVTGFQGLTEPEKERLWPHVSEYIQAKHFSDVGQGAPIKIELLEGFPARMAPKDNAMRLVVPGPSCSISDVELKQDESNGTYKLYANRDFVFGEEVYTFWNVIWPQQGEIPVDMISASHLLDGDVPEGTVMRVHPQEHGREDSMGRIRFSGYDLLVSHSCEPNLVYNYKDEDEDDDWRGTYAARPIKKGEILSIDFNTACWDRSGVPGTSYCLCGASKCRGTQMGFLHLSKEEQDELKMLSWRRVPPPYTGETRLVSPGDALSPHVHAGIRRQTANKENTDETDVSETSSNTSASYDGNSSSEED